MPDLGDLLGPGFDEVLAELVVISVDSDRTGSLPRRAFAALRSAGFGRMRLPVDDGGLGASVPQLLDAIRRLAAADSGIAQSWRTHVIATERHLASAASPTRTRWLRRIADGAILGGGWSEADGSGAARFTTRLERFDGRLTLSGRKFYSTGSAYADWLEYSAVGEDGRDVVVAVPATAPGITILDDWDGFGQRATASGTTILDTVPVDEGDLVPFSDFGPGTGGWQQATLLAVLAGIAEGARQRAAALVGDSERRGVATGLHALETFGRISALAAVHAATGGRFAWNAVTTWDVEAVRNFGIAELPEREERYARAEEFVRAVLDLWAAGDEGVHRGGRFVRVDGALAGADRVPGRPAVLQAGGSAPGQRLAGLVADAVFSIEHDPAEAQLHRRQVAEQAVLAGRGADAVRIYPGLAIVIGSTEREAWERFEHWEHQAPPTYSLNELSKALGADLGDADLDAPVPAAVVDAAEQEGKGWSTGYRRVLVRRIRTERPTIRALLRDFGGYGQRFVAGTPEAIADSMEAWFRAGAADGFNVMLDLFPSGLVDFVDQVVPELQRRGLFRTEYADGTLLDRFRSP
ncbi:LLM class flavin-dependent oxidoreductase [uncultured Amnibacterium sp.]|uniref:LLM class flavin-dependent oxidoreductase n=1 Tax=uncultured Amnibacterium sp. TaxID=1631851 RepID=UPI0035CC11AF